MGEPLSGVLEDRFSRRTSIDGPRSELGDGWSQYSVVDRRRGTIRRNAMSNSGRPALRGRGVRPTQAYLVVVLQPQMRDQFLALEMAQGVLQLHQLDEQVVLGIEAWHRHRRLKVKA